MRAQTLAELVVSGCEQYGWFDDGITLASVHAPPFSSDEASRVRESRRALGEDIVYVRTQIPSCDSFPSVAAVGELHDVLVKRGSIAKEVGTGELTPLKANTPEVVEAARALLTICSLESRGRQMIDHAIVLGDLARAHRGAVPKAQEPLTSGIVPTIRPSDEERV